MALSFTAKQLQLLHLNVRIFNGPYIQQSGYSFVIKLIESFYSVWNLDIFRPFSPGICLPVKASDILWLDLAVGGISSSYLAYSIIQIIKLYNNIVSIFVCLWNVVKRLFTKSWSISSSLIELHFLYCRV